MVIHLITDHSNHFSHGKCSQDCTNSKSVQMSEDDTGHQCSHCKADNIEADLDSGILYFCDICQFPRKQICRDNRQTSAVGECDSYAQKQVADNKIKYPVTNSCWQDINPHFMYIKHLTECKSNNKTKKIRCNKFPSHDHQ